jgi:hypothetical protein
VAHVAFQMIVFNGDYFLEAVLEAVRPYGPILATEGPVRYWQQRGFTTSTDRTNEILEAYNVPTWHGVFEEKDDMMRAVEDLLPSETTHIWMVDSDEIWKPAAIERTLKVLDQYDSVSFKPYTFYGGFDRYLTGFEERAEWIRIQRWHPGAHWKSHRPPTVLHADGKPMRQHRHLESAERFFHYSYLFPSQVQSKVAYYESWGAGVIPNYFERVYLRWVNSPPMQRERVEREFQGVHEWLPERRGDCFTKAFEGRHPSPIFKRMPEYVVRMYHELREQSPRVEAA